MKTKVVTIGNSRGIRIPKVLLEESGIEVDVEITLSRDGLKIVPVRTKVRRVPETALLSEASLARDWDRPEEDAAWRHL